MLLPLDALSAYRQDLTSVAGVSTFGDDDASWVLVVLAIQRLARARATRVRSRADGEPADATQHSLRQTLGSALAGTLGQAGGREDDGSADDAFEHTLIDGVLRAVEQMETAGTLHTAYAALEAAPRAFPGAPVRVHALMLLHRARVARKIGALDAAQDLYEMALRASRTAHDAEVGTRALIGSAVVARRRGNYPASRRLYERALSSARRAMLTALQADAHQGLLIAASTAGDLPAALVHGWQALTLVAGTPAREAEVLSNLGAVASEAGEYSAALGSYLSAAARTTEPRVQLPALSGAAVCAARVGAMARMRAIATATEDLLSGSTLPYENAHALSALAEAWEIIGDREAAEARWVRALDIARTHAFHELVLAAEASCDRLKNAAGAAAPAGEPDQRREAVVWGRAHAVLRELESLQRDERRALIGVP